jgi:hypothetical protein
MKLNPYTACAILLMVFAVSCVPVEKVSYLYASFILLVCRNDYTRKDLFTEVLNLSRKNNIDNFDIVFNDLNLKKSRYGRYDNYYKQEKASLIPKFS